MASRNNGALATNKGKTVKKGVPTVVADVSYPGEGYWHTRVEISKQMVTPMSKGCVNGAEIEAIRLCCLSRKTVTWESKEHTYLPQRKAIEAATVQAMKIFEEYKDPDARIAKLKQITRFTKDNYEVIFTEKTAKRPRACSTGRACSR